MKKALVFGSLNYDYVYQVDHAVLPGETLASEKLETFFGGKGFNQSVALARAGIPVYHAGLLGEDGEDFLKECGRCGVNTELIEQVSGRSGHTVIQLDKNGENCILLYGGANRKITAAYVERVLSHFVSGDVILLQNEISCLEPILQKASEKGMRIFLNPSPFEPYLNSLPLHLVAFLAVNEVEAAQITGESDPIAAREKLLSRFPETNILLTLGKQGAYYLDHKTEIFQPAFPVNAVDTTAAGDTFTGFFAAGIMEGMPAADAMRLAAKAASIAVTRMGASPSIPSRDEVEKSLRG